MRPPVTMRMVCQTALRRKRNIGPVGPTSNHQQGWWFVTSGVKAFLYEVEYDILVFYRCGMSVTEETVYEMTESLYEDMYGNLPWYPDLAKVYRNGKGN